MFKTLKRKMNEVQAYVTTNLLCAQAKLQENSGQFVMEHTVIFVLILVLAAIAMTLLIAFLKSTIAPTVETKTLDFFNLS